jgi:hypothetical protein
VTRRPERVAPEVESVRPAANRDRLAGEPLGLSVGMFGILGYVLSMFAYAYQALMMALPLGPVGVR